jgi:hypothetical protein
MAGAYYKDPNGLVHLRGAMDAGTFNVAMFVLPVNFRPIANLDFPNLSNGSPAQCSVLTDGSIIQRGGSSILTELNGVYFDSGSPP